VYVHNLLGSKQIDLFLVDAVSHLGKMDDLGESDRFPQQAQGGFLPLDAGVAGEEIFLV
jgi:hypothetical protein